MSDLKVEFELIKAPPALQLVDILVKAGTYFDDVLNEDEKFRALKYALPLIIDNKSNYENHGLLSWAFSDDKESEKQVNHGQSTGGTHSWRDG